MTHILAIDQGTTSTRAIVFDAQDARPIASAQIELKQHFPQPGWVEHDPIAIVNAAVSVARQAVERAGLHMRDIACMGITNQRETTVVWERATGRPVANAIVWQCRRTAEVCRNLEDAGHGPDIRSRTGLVLDAYFSATKLRWLLDHVPDGQKRAADGELCFGTVDSWLLFRLTMRGAFGPVARPEHMAGPASRASSGILRPAQSAHAIHATDSTNASRTMLLNLHDLRWDPDLLSLFDIPEVMLPDVLPCAADFGVTAPEVLGAEVPVTGIAGDQHAALYGEACFEPGMVKCTYGTGAFVLSVTGAKPPVSSAAARRTEPGPDRESSGSLSMSSPSPTGRGDGHADHGLIATLGWEAGRKRAYALEGSVFITGAAVQWLRDGLCIINSSSEASALADSIEDNAGVYFVPAFVGLGAPHWDASARGTVTGLTRGSTRAHIARAALEAAAYQVRDVVAAMDAAARRMTSSQPLRVDGGQTASEFLMQFQADILGRPVEVSAVPEASALGAAFLAGRGAAIWRSEKEVAGLWQSAHRYEPQMTESRRQTLIAGWNDAVRRTRLLAT